MSLQTIVTSLKRFFSRKPSAHMLQLQQAARSREDAKREQEMGMHRFSETMRISKERETELDKQIKELLGGENDRI